MKIIFKYRDESPFLMPGYSRYNEVIGMSGEKHVGMIHLAHKDWRGKWSHDDGKTWDKEMPHTIEVTIMPTGKGHVATKEIEKNVEESGKPDVPRSKGVAKRPEAKPAKSEAPAKSRSPAEDKAGKRRNGKSPRRGR